MPIPLSVTLTTPQSASRVTRSSIFPPRPMLLGRIRQQVRENLRKAIDITLDPQFLCARLYDEFVAVRIDGTHEQPLALLAKMSCGSVTFVCGAILFCRS